MKYTDLVFDLYGTLVDIHTEETERVWEKCALYFGFYGAHYTASELKTAFEDAMAARCAKAGASYECFPDIPFESVLAELFRAAGVSENADALALNAAQIFRISSIEYLRLYPNVVECLETLRARGYRLWLLSNAQRAFTAYELSALGLGRQFDGILLSSDYRCRKPDIRFFRALLDTYALDPSRCLMIGNDRETDIAGAKNAAMGTFFMHTNLTPPDQLPADPKLSPEKAPSGSRHFEFEGSDWLQIVRSLAHI